MSLLVMSTQPTPSNDRLSPSWIRRTISRKKKPAPESESRPSTSSGRLTPRPISSRSNSDESRSTLSKSIDNRTSFRGVVNRLRSSSSASSLGGKSRDENDIHDWFQGFKKYNQLVTTKISPEQSHDSPELFKVTKTLTKNCGGQLIHGLPDAAFDFALLWCPVSELTRRNANEPSWSWTAFNGAVNYPFDPTTCPDICNAPRADGEVFRSEVTNYHIGPAAAQYTIRREKNASMRTKYPPYFHAPRGADASVDSNTLRFSAQTISANAFSSEQLHYQDEEISCCQLLDAQDQHCGVIMDRLSALSEPSEDGPFEFILLSRNLRREPEAHTRRPANPTIHPPGTPIWDGERFVWDQVVVDFDDEVFEEGPWKMLNVMLIKWVGDCAERVAIARIHEDAWAAQSPEKKEIVLC